MAVLHRRSQQFLQLSKGSLPLQLGTLLLTAKCIPFSKPRTCPTSLRDLRFTTSRHCFFGCFAVWLRQIVSIRERKKDPEEKTVPNWLDRMLRYHVWLSVAFRRSSSRFTSKERVLGVYLYCSLYAGTITAPIDLDDSDLVHLWWKSFVSALPLLLYRHLLNYAESFKGRRQLLKVHDLVHIDDDDSETDCDHDKDKREQKADNPFLAVGPSTAPAVAPKGIPMPPPITSPPPPIPPPALPPQAPAPASRLRKPGIPSTARPVTFNLAVPHRPHAPQISGDDLLDEDEQNVTFEKYAVFPPVPAKFSGRVRLIVWLTVLSVGAGCSAFAILYGQGSTWVFPLKPDPTDVTLQLVLGLVASVFIWEPLFFLCSPPPCMSRDKDQIHPDVADPDDPANAVSNAWAENEQDQLTKGA
mmetsp:Transcript_40697/g.79825  ORF Transcript_40697/g.79825 Transcript_40697/m.79825 type:complete len:414 (+) Transcript_40697:511-1752(+)